MTRSSRSTAAILVAGLVIVGCTRPEDALPASGSLPPVPTAGTTVETSTDSSTDSTTTTSVTDTTDSTADSTSPPSSTTPSTAGPTTAAPATSAAATTLAPTSPADLTLIFDGILPFRFGDRDVDVVPGLADVLGAPVRDDLVEFPDAVNGSFIDESGEQSYVAPFGRTVCFANSLCVQFGAGAPETLIFTGWQVDGNAASDMTTEDGVAIGSTLADHADVITFDPAVSCYQVAFGAAAGIDVTLLSDDGVFAAPTAAGDGVDLFDPDPSLVTVQAMSAGELPVFLFADC